MTEKMTPQQEEHPTSVERLLAPLNPRAEQMLLSTIKLMELFQSNESSGKQFEFEMEVRLDGLALEDVPEALKTSELCTLALKEGGCAL